MTKNIVTVLSFTVFDMGSGQSETVPRKATREAIARVQGTALEETAEEVDAARLDGNGFLNKK